MQLSLFQDDLFGGLPQIATPSKQLNKKTKKPKLTVAERKQAAEIYQELLKMQETLRLVL
jgi:hypothetical protein